ncbi:MAG: carboxypeptidase-like regulatory domain-containing protein, partial [Ignavibacteriales bacterium]|nr:carboxypeptidase-like regulatory domain-containing protein [Ignavibacteriales bacterium]
MKIRFFHFVIFIISAAVLAQATGNVEGKIIDVATGDPLPGVNVLVKGTYWGAATDVNGYFKIDKIKPGSYIIEASFIGYKTMQYTDITVEANKTTKLNVEMQESALTLDQDVVVIGEKPLIDVEETQSKKSITKEDIDLAVVENIQDVVTQQAGVIKSDNAIHIRGGRSYENAFLLDGVSVQDPLAGTGFGLQLSASAIEEVEVITGGFNAEFGQATSGVVNARTREGSDKYSGYISYKRDNLGDKESFHVFNIDILESNISGPEPLTSYLLPALGIKIPGKITFFGNFYVGLSDGITQGYYKSTADKLYSSTFYGTRFSPRQENSWFWLGKITYNITPTMKLAYSFNQSININQNSQSLQSNLEYVEPSPGYQYEFQYIPNNANVFTHNNKFHSLSWTHTVSSSMFYELKINH